MKPENKGVLRRELTKKYKEKNGYLLVNFYNVALNDDANEYNLSFHAFTSDW